MSLWWVQTRCRKNPTPEPRLAAVVLEARCSAQPKTCPSRDLVTATVGHCQFRLVSSVALLAKGGTFEQACHVLQGSFSQRFVSRHGRFVTSTKPELRSLTVRTA